MADNWRNAKRKLNMKQKNLIIMEKYLIEKLKALRQLFARRLLCLIGKHNVMYYEIDEKAVQVCQHCKYTEYEFITGWHKIDRTLAIDEYLNNNA